MKGETKMKRLAAVAFIAALMAGVITGCGAGGKDIGRDAALEAALNDAGVSESDTSRLQVSEDRDDGRKVYEIRFDVGQTEYDYEIQASDGQILSSETESTENASGSAQGNATQADDDAQSNAAQNGGNADASQNQSGNASGNVAVSREQAAATALERVPGATENDLRMELDYDDGIQIYEGDIIYEQIEYEFEINANTGEIISWSEERY